MPNGWNWITGHFLLFIRTTKRFPSDANINLSLKLLGDDFPREETYLLDMWPVAAPMLVLSSPEATIQVTQKYNLLKTKMIGDMVLPITGGPNLLSMNDNEWKVWRTLFNPGFSTASLTAQIPSIVDSVEIFCALLRETACNKTVVCLDDMTMRLTFDVIIKVSL